MAKKKKAKTVSKSVAKAKTAKKTAVKKQSAGKASTVKKASSAKKSTAAKSPAKPAAKSAAKKVGAKKPTPAHKTAAPPKVVKKQADVAKKQIDNKADDARRAGFAHIFTPLDNRVVVERKVQSDRTPGGLYIPDTVTERSSEGEVVAVGPGHRTKRKGQLRPLDVKVGDKVLFHDFAGAEVTVEDCEYLILKEDEILGIVNP